MTANAVANPAHPVTGDTPAIDKPQSNLMPRLMEIRVGIIPLPVYVLLLGLIATFSVMGKISGEVTVMIAVLVVGGFTCAEIGRRIPILNVIGGSSLVTIFLPSFLVAHQLLPAPLIQQVTTFTKSTNFIYLLSPQSWWGRS